MRLCHHVRLCLLQSATCLQTLYIKVFPRREFSHFLCHIDRVLNNASCKEVFGVKRFLYHYPRPRIRSRSTRWSGYYWLYSHELLSLPHYLFYLFDHLILIVHVAAKPLHLFSLSRFYIVSVIRRLRFHFSIWEIIAFPYLLVILTSALL